MSRTYSPGDYVDTARSFPRVAVPGVDRDAVADLDERREFLRNQRMGFVLSFIRRGITPAAPITGNERKARRAAGKRQRAGRRATR
jgi:hypothetical protein